MRDELEQRLQHVQVRRHDTMDLRTEDLHPDDSPVMELGTVHNSDRCASDRIRVYLRVRVLDRHSEVGLDAVADQLEVDGRPGV